MGKRRVNFQRCWLPVSRIGLHRRGVERVNCGPKLLDLGEKGVYSSYTLSAAGQKEYVHAHRGETGCERGFKHIARQARILADHDTMAVVTATKDTYQPPCRRARRFPPSSRLRWLCHEYRLCRNICAP